MKSYLEIQVPIAYNAPWFEELRSIMAGVPVKWQVGYYHITIAFLNETPENVDLCSLLEKHLSNGIAPMLTFDKLDAFTTWGGMHIINLTATNIPANFLSLTAAIRSDMKDVGCIIESDFLLHVTLGRVNESNITLSNLQKMIGSVSIPPFNLMLEDVDYREFRGKTIYETKLNKKNKL